MNQAQQCIKVVGFDPSLRHWGISCGNLNVDPKGYWDLKITSVSVTEAILSKGKQVRQNSLDLETAQQLCKAAIEASIGAQAIFVEVPIGSQTARAMASYGICVGVLGALRATGIPFFEVTPSEVKVQTVGDKTASKQQMIDWAVKHHPEANWPKRMEHGKEIITASKAEHIADAIAAIHAGIHGNEFKQMLKFLMNKAS